MISLQQNVCEMKNTKRVVVPAIGKPNLTLSAVTTNELNLFETENDYLSHEED
jgi:hypothetical protein